LLVNDRWNFSYDRKLSALRPPFDRKGENSVFIGKRDKGMPGLPAENLKIGHGSPISRQNP
jgi:hypothetical protein